MKAFAPLALGLAALGAVACKPEVEAPPPADAPVETEAATAPEAAAPVVATVDASGQPAFAPVYPEAELTGPVTRAEGPAGPGGMAQFTTTATPDTVVAFYRQRAEAAGLATTSSLSQGETRGYKAANADGAASVEVVATPIGESTAVQLSWSAPR